MIANSAPSPALGSPLSSPASVPGAADPGLRTLIDELLLEQQRLSAVERFSRRHDAGKLSSQTEFYRDLIPDTRPAPGQQLAFAVDLDACTGCKACVAACHSLNGLEEGETWRSVGFIHGDSDSVPYQQTITTACHHCVEPGCMEGCPVMAYDKDADTGIVRHLDDQCIGCQYCMLKCPYDVPKYSERLGIVRKCDMCIGRLEAGEAPACVQACPTSAIRIEIVEQAAVRSRATPGSSMVPGAFDSSYTKPATRYHTRKSLPPNAAPADERVLPLSHAHWPLIGMLLLTQAAAGVAALHAMLLAFGLSGASANVLAAMACGILQAGLGVSVFHLGRPLGAWRFFLGLRTSWMSREILTFGVFAMIATLSAIVPFVPGADGLVLPIALATALTGLGAVFTSAMIYIDTRRPSWIARFTMPKFFGTTLVLGSSIAAAILGSSASGIAMATIGLVARAVLHGWEVSTQRDALPDPSHAAHTSALTAQTHLSHLLRARTPLFVIATIATFLGMSASGSWATSFHSVALLCTVGMQLIERYTFFTTATSARMPGGIPT